MIIANAIRQNIEADKGFLGLFLKMRRCAIEADGSNGGSLKMCLIVVVKTVACSRKMYDLRRPEK